MDWGTPSSSPASTSLKCIFWGPVKVVGSEARFTLINLPWAKQICQQPEISTSPTTSEEICRFGRDVVGVYMTKVINIAQFWGCFWHVYILSVFASSFEGLQTCVEETGGGWIYSILLVWIRVGLSHAPLHCSRCWIVHQQKKKEQWHCWLLFSLLFANG